MSFSSQVNEAKDSARPRMTYLTNFLTLDGMSEVRVKSCHSTYEVRFLLGVLVLHLGYITLLG